jgi:lipoprotein-anchoring transpeptidase ErfK/SrfK
MRVLLKNWGWASYLHVMLLFRFAIIDIFVSSSILPASARKKHREQTPNKPNVEAATRLQIFLDPANFGPGKIDTKTNMLGVFQGEKFIAAYPVTIGSAQTASPIGEWKVSRIAKMPTFRYDKEMLQHGKRSGNFHLLPPGPVIRLA